MENGGWYSDILANRANVVARRRMSDRRTGNQGSASRRSSIVRSPSKRSSIVRSSSRRSNDRNVVDRSSSWVSVSHGWDTANRNRADRNSANRDHAVRSNTDITAGVSHCGTSASINTADRSNIDKGLVNWRKIVAVSRVRRSC